MAATKAAYFQNDEQARKGIKSIFKLEFKVLLFLVEVFKFKEGR